MLEKNLIGKYDTPIRAIYPAHAKSPFYTNMNYAFRVFSFNPRKVSAKDAPKSWDDLLQPKWKNEILFDESSLEEVMAMLAAWGKERTVNYLTKLTQQNLLIRVGRDTTTQMMMAGEANVAVTTYAYNNEKLARAERAGGLGRRRSDPSLDLSAHFGAQRASSLRRSALLRLSDLGRRQRLIAKEGARRRPSKVDPIYPRMKELQNLLGTPRIQLNTLEQNAKLLKDGVEILDEIVLKRNPPVTKGEKYVRRETLDHVAFSSARSAALGKFYLETVGLTFLTQRKNADGSPRHTYMQSRRKHRRADLARRRRAGFASRRAALRHERWRMTSCFASYCVGRFETAA
jgi:hypothetical protein